MHRFQYVVWIRDIRLPPDDQDYEWPAVFAIEADTAEAAQRWGDHLAHAHMARSGERFVRSHVEPQLGETNIPVVVYGHEATDEEIGW